MQRLVKVPALLLAVVGSAACASTSNPYRAHDRTGHLKVALAEGDMSCPVVIQNRTGQLLETRVRLAGSDRNLGFLADGQSAVVSVECRSREVHARAIGHTPGPLKGARFAKTARLDLTRETSVRFTTADRARW